MLIKVFESWIIWKFKMFPIIIINRSFQFVIVWVVGSWLDRNFLEQYVTSHGISTERGPNFEAALDGFSQ